jgi:coproporphyrinogen III oxidase-like Fe-S oxidoreductase
MLNALRLLEGSDFTTFEARTGLARKVLDTPFAQALERGWLQIEGESFRASERGQQFQNDLLGLFLAW